MPETSDELIKRAHEKAAAVFKEWHHEVEKNTQAIHPVNEVPVMEETPKTFSYTLSTSVKDGFGYVFATVSRSSSSDKDIYKLVKVELYNSLSLEELLTKLDLMKEKIIELSKIELRTTQNADDWPKKA
jgi:hypothetical protein